MSKSANRGVFEMYELINSGIKRFMDIILWITFIGSIIIGFVSRGWSLDFSPFADNAVTFSLGSALFGAVLGGIVGLVLNFIYGGIIVTLISLRETAEVINHNLCVIANNNNAREENTMMNNEPIFQEHVEKRTTRSVAPEKAERIGQPVMPKKNEDIKMQWPD